MVVHSKQLLASVTRFLVERTEADSEESIISVVTSGLGTEASSPHVFPSPPSQLSQLKTDKLNRGRQLGEVCQVAPCV